MAQSRINLLLGAKAGASPFALLKKRLNPVGMTKSHNIAFLGIGVMGAPMAAFLAKAGHQVTAYNRTASKAETLASRVSEDGLQMRTALSPADAAREAEIVISCVGNDDDLAQILEGEDGALAAMAAGTLFIDHTTVSPDMARTVAGWCAERELDCLDAPVSGGQAGAENGTLAIMCGGTDQAYMRAEPIMQAYGKTIIHVGDAGAGQTAKMANQMCIAGVLGGLSEAVRLTQASGVDPDKVLAAISGGAAQSWQMENRWQTMVADEFDFGFAIDWMRKDLGYALAEADRLGLDSPVSRLVDSFYADIQAMDGGGRQDTSALIRRLPR